MKNGQGRDRTADTRIFSLIKRLCDTTEGYNKTLENKTLLSFIIASDSGRIVPWRWNRDGTDFRQHGDHREAEGGSNGMARLAGLLPDYSRRVAGIVKVLCLNEV